MYHYYSSHSDTDSLHYGPHSISRETVNTLASTYSGDSVKYYHDPQYLDKFDRAVIQMIQSAESNKESYIESNYSTYYDEHYGHSSDDTSDLSHYYHGPSHRTRYTYKTHDFSDLTYDYSAQTYRKRAVRRDPDSHSDHYHGG